LYVRREMKKALILCSVGGMISAGIFHALALRGTAVGGGTPLIALCPFLLICFGSAVLRVVLRGLEERQARLDLGSSVPPVVLWPCLVLTFYGFVQGYRGGKVSYRPGEMLAPERAAVFYGMLLSFFAIALLFHIAASIGDAPNNGAPPNGGPRRSFGDSGGASRPPSVS
jgi:hypothetical protein